MKAEVSQSDFPPSVSASSGKRTRFETLTALSQALLREVGALHGDEISSPGEIDLAKEIESYESDLIRSALMQTGGRQSDAARLLNVKPSTLNAKIKRYGLLEKTQIVF